MPLSDEIAKALTTPGLNETAAYIAGGVGLKKLYEDCASPTVKQAGLLGAKIFSALVVSADAWADRRKKRFENLQDDIVENLKNKKPEEITETPPEYIIAPAINSYMYSMDKIELRKMYANLISNAMLKENTDKIHPTLTTIIQNLHPNESILLSYLYSHGSMPIIETHWNNATDEIMSYNIPLTHFYLYPTKITPTLSNSMTATSFSDFTVGSPTYISNLSRLGLIDVDYRIFLTEENAYDDLINHPIVTQNEYHCKCEKEKKEFEIIKGVIKITPLGKDFIKICL